MGAINAIAGGSPASFNASTTGASDDALKSLASASGVDATQLGGIVNDLKAGLESGNSAKTNQAISDLMALLKSGSEASASNAASGGSSGGGSAADPSAGSAGDDTLNQLGKMLESLGMPKDQIDKIVNQARQAGVGGDETAAGNASGSNSSDSIGGVKAA
jgi:hypothetical protein